MHALRLVHSALVAGGTLVDVYPTACRAPVEARGRVLGRLDDSGWAKVVGATQARLAELVSEGLFEPETGAERDVLIRYPSAPEMLDDVAGWQGTVIPSELPHSVRAAEPPIDVRERVLYRVYRRP